MACLSLEVCSQSVHPNLVFPGSMSERGKILLCISSQKAPKQKRVQQETVLNVSMFYFNILCDICFYGGAKHFWRGRICYREGSCSRQIWHASPQYVPTIVSCSGLSTDNPGIATTLQACPSFGQLQSQVQHLLNSEHELLKWVDYLFARWSHMPLWYLLLWWCQAFFDGQNFEQIGQL